LPALTNFILDKTALPSLLGFTSERKLPLLAKQTFSAWYKKHYPALVKSAKLKKGKKVYLFNDEFTNHYDVELGQKAVKLLVALGYEVLIPEHVDSGRAYISKGLIRKAKKLAEKNVRLLKEVITKKTPLIGIEPSAILSFRDEYPDLVEASLRHDARQLAGHTFLIDEFVVQEFKAGSIDADVFHGEEKHISLHCHCHQKAIASSQSTLDMLSIPKNYHVAEIPSGCCGMAGSFGYEKEHYELSQQIGELVLFKQVEQLPGNTLVVAQGTSCRSQIKDGTKREALHPVEVLFGALR
jgi:Fe-S oxidoreductase